ncbi:alpha/beta hydrolase [Kitasatospora sp. NRRL B-11411]|uniref:alpha/beta hydrolase n=1 Tax=Kitasatospora sp. NRRL B-11411 TaxID=1463822 RepID=UPI00056818A8|nr:alpha/beta hydrolase [Kitasatospora sp. NRRL B-11411]
MPELLPQGGAGGADGAAVRGVVLLLPGGAVRGHGRPSRLAAFGMAEPARRLAAAGRADGVAVVRLRYRFRGWNGAEADTLADARWALDAVRAAHGPGVRIGLLGNSLGGRAAFRAADGPGVVAVAGVAPWLPDGEPVGQVAGRAALIVHGDRDRGEAGAAHSLAYAERARPVTALRRLEVAGAGHLLLSRAADAWAPAVDFLLDALAGRDPFGRLPPEDAAAPLRTPVPVGYGARGGA